MDATKREALVAALQNIVGSRHVLTDPALFAGALVEPRKLYKGQALALVRPGSTKEVASVAAFCNEARIAMVPQGGNTGLVGGQTPDLSGDGDHRVDPAPARDPRGRHRQQRDDLRIGRHARGSAGRGARRRSAVSAVAGVGGNMHRRRKHLDQRWRPERDRLWQYARSCHRRRGGARRWPHRQRLEQVAQGQHRLRREEPFYRRRRNARHHHGRFAPALSQSSRAGDGLRWSQEPRGCVEAFEAGSRAARRRDHELRAHQPQRLRHWTSTRRRARSVARRA